MKTREIASIVVFLLVAVSFLAANQNNKLENERIERESSPAVYAQR